MPEKRASREAERKWRKATEWKTEKQAVMRKWEMCMEQSKERVCVFGGER